MKWFNSQCSKISKNFKKMYIADMYKLTIQLFHML